jgi:hypothetical protein
MVVLNLAEKIRFSNVVKVNHTINLQIQLINASKWIERFLCKFL